VQAAPAFTHLTLTGGAIGCGPPVAVGAALAQPQSVVINIQVGNESDTPQPVCLRHQQSPQVSSPGFLVCRLTAALYTPCKRCGRKPGSSCTSSPSSAQTGHTPSSRYEHR